MDWRISTTRVVYNSCSHVSFKPALPTATTHLPRQLCTIGNTLQRAPESAFTVASSKDLAYLVCSALNFLYPDRVYAGCKARNVKILRSFHVVGVNVEGPIIHGHVVRNRRQQ